MAFARLADQSCDFAFPVDSLVYDSVAFVAFDFERSIGLFAPRVDKSGRHHDFSGFAE
jgi:hypothetical protein